MSTADTRSTAPRRGLLGRRAAADDGPRASFRELLPYLTEHRGALAAVIVLSILSAAASLAQPLLVSQVISIVEAGRALGWLVWVLIGLVVGSAVLSGLQHYILQRTGTSVVLSARRQLVRRMLRLPISEFDTRRTGDLVSRVGSDTTLLYAVMTQGLLDAVGGALLFLGALIAMLVLDPVLLGLTVLVVAVSVVAVTLLSARIRVASREQQERVGDLAAAVERAISAIRTVRAANATGRETEVVERDAVGAWRAGVKVAKISALVVPIAGIAMQVSFLVVLGVGGFRVASGELTIANLVAFILFLFMMIMPLGQAFGAINSVNQALGALGRIQEIVRTPAEDADDAAATPAPDGDAAAAIEFEEVVFGYPDAAHRTETEKTVAAAVGEAALAELGDEDARREGEVLRGVSFQVPRGSRVALVGPSGAGKSTVLALVERFYDPESGVVRLGGKDVRGLERDALRGQIGYVEQDAPVLAGTIRDNLLLAAPGASDEACERVLRAVNLGEVLGRSPLGLDAQVGEDGVMLSGGERQRLAIARALLAAPPILLLDEATASLDGLNEQLLREAIDTVAEDRTLLVIAHRLSTVVDSDRIVVLDRGRVAGVGTHSELVASVPLYRDLAKHQLLV
ncbi:ABC transporter ATP-binding protein [Homoserinibacter sp. YIM 151385]|uniref:ABC transporter ATP-binding protein n=1 Tax=Homoserinibacter sp. YIM 151385 TaxID=2985506 RepID=UPI0022F0370C|nr:ABC transporter ATP-binding protein [Homoserinibacter sp. YIM 151385]WBU36845.1 ABC transporter ATP-binding protein [Homoserinibacter sp. YIM 151385]